MRVGRFKFAVLLASVVVLTVISIVQAREIGPEDHFCRAINDPASGEELLLRPGEYTGPCMIRRGGTAERPLVIRAQRPEQRPQIIYEGDSANVLEIRADHVVIEGLAFGPTRKNVDGIRIRASRDVAVIDCQFTGMGGIAVVANQSSLKGLRVSSNVINRVNATAMYFGCHDGAACRLSDVIIEKNHIEGVNAGEREVGYGIQVKLNSTAVIRDNFVRNTKGPGIMIYGARDDDAESVIERNFVAGSQTSSGIVIGGGPALARNNISIGNAAAGIALQDYGQWGLLRRVKVGFNTLLDNSKGALSAPPAGAIQALVVGNVGSAPAGVAVFPEKQNGLAETDNVACDKSCFADPEQMDLSAAKGSILDRRAVEFYATWVPEQDFFSQRREQPLKAGAVQTAGRPLGGRAGH
jgi:hypothetical protein